MLWIGDERGKTMVMRMSKQPYRVQVIFNQKQLKNLKFFKYLGNMTTNSARCTHEIKDRIAMAKAEFKKKIIFFTSKVDLSLSKKLAKSYIWSRTLHGAEMWTFRQVDQKYLKNFELWWRTRMDKDGEGWRRSSEPSCEKQEVLLTIKEKRDILI
jgi:uncharacterized protein (DUF1919 family)